MDMLENQIMDFRMSLVMVCYNPDFVSVLHAGGPVPTLGTPCQRWGPHIGRLHPILTPPSLPPSGEAQARLPGAAPGEAEALLQLLGGQKVVCRGEGTARAAEGAEGAGEGFVLTVSPPCPQLTFVDFLMFDVLDQNRIFEPKCLEPFKNLKEFMERFGVSREGHPEVPPGGDTPDTPCVSPGSGEGGCLHEVQPFPEDAHQQQDGQVGQQEAVGAQHGAGRVGGSPNPAPPNILHP